jgi:5-oxoprolinase (ATP-hydrolysing)
MEAKEVVEARFDVLRGRVREELRSQGLQDGEGKVKYEMCLSMRYEGTDTNISISQPEDGDFGRAFVEQHRREFAFELVGRKVVIDSVRVRGVGKGLENEDSKTLFEELKNVIRDEKPTSVSNEKQSVYFDSMWVEIPVFLLKGLKPGESIEVSTAENIESRCLLC